MSIKYQTKQKEILLNLMKNTQQAPFSASDLMAMVESLEISPSRATIYRLLDELEQQGKVRKYFLENQTTAMYQYLPEIDCSEHFHAVCDDCGHLFHIQCKEVDQLIEHLSHHHHFQVNVETSVFHGYCESCQLARKL